MVLCKSLKAQARNFQIMHVLHKLILSTSKMTEGTKHKNVHWWKETAFFYMIIVLREGNQTRFELFSKIF